MAAPLVRRTSAARTSAFVAWTLRHGRWLWLTALVLAIPATFRTAGLYLHLRSNLEELLPTSAPSVIALDELRARMPGLQHLGVVVDCGDASQLPAAERFLDDLAARVRAYPPSLVNDVRTSDAAERRFVESHLAVYTNLADLRTLRARIEERRDYDVEKASGELLDEDTPPPPLDFRDIQGKYERSHRFDDDRFSSASLHLTLLLVRLAAFDSGHSRAAELLGRVRHDVDDLHVAHYSPALRVGFAGDVAINVEETSALVSDLSISSVVVVALVVAVILIYYRWWPSIAILVPPLLLATAFAFGLASLPPLSITALNSNTAFLGSIIVGNGINFGIVLLARYVEARRSGIALETALETAVAGATKGTLAAALAAGASYASLALTQFRGFRQFGLVGGLGMVLSWTVAFLLMPPLIAWIDRRGAWASSRTTARWTPMGWIARGVTFAPKSVLIASLALTLLAVWKAHTLDASWIESDFSRLRRADTWEHGEGYWGRKMDALLGTYLTPTVILADDVSRAREIGATVDQMRKTTPLSERIASVRTLDSVLPPDQAEKIAEVRAIQDDLTPRIRAALAPKELELLDRLTSPEGMKPLVIRDLPAELTTGLRERNGTLGREVLVFPRPTRALWQGAALEEFVEAVRAAGGANARVAGSLPLSADILAAVRHDGPSACLAALVGVVLSVLLVLRPGRASAIVVSSLLVAVTWLLAAMMALGVRINFANFIAYPITFGIGVDYVVNVVSRYSQSGQDGVAATLRSTGGAVALCSLTTVIGYSSLLMAQNRGLFFFGGVAVLGEACCLCTAVVAVPAFLEWHARRAGSAGEARPKNGSSRSHDPARTLDAR